MPHAALWVVQQHVRASIWRVLLVSMPHAALWVVQLLNCNGTANANTLVSMPHAALWVVQRRTPATVFAVLVGFNAARGFVGGAARG